MQTVVEITWSVLPGTAKKANSLREDSMGKEEYSIPCFFSTLVRFTSGNHKEQSEYC